MKKKVLILISIFWISILFSGCNNMKISFEKINKQIEASASSHLSVENINGSISVTVSNSDQILIRIEKRSYFGKRELKKVDVKIDNDGKSIKIKTMVNQIDANVTVDYFIQVPSTIFVSALESKNGNIIVKQSKGDIFVQTSNGSITFEKIDGWISAYTQNGTVKAIGITGIKEIKTTNGSVDCEISNLPQEGTQISTNNANIKIKVIHNGGMYLDLTTTNGSIMTKNLDERITHRTNFRHQSKIKEGGKTLYARTENGNIEISK